MTGLDGESSDLPTPLIYTVYAINVQGHFLNF